MQPPQMLQEQQDPLWQPELPKDDVKIFAFPLQVVESSRLAIASQLDRMSSGMDNFFFDTFFGDEDFITEDRKSRLRLSTGSDWETGQGLGYTTSISLRLALPNTQERFKLLLETDDEEQQQSESPLNSLDNNDITTTLRFIPEWFRDWETSLDAGVRFRAPLNPFVRSRFLRVTETHHWTYRWRQEFFWFNDIGVGEESSFAAIRPIGFDYQFRATSRARYLLDDGFFEFRQQWALFHELSIKQALRYEFNVSGRSAHSRVTNYQLAVRYRQNIYKNWLFFEVVPRVDYPEEENFDTTPSLSLRLEMLVNNR